MPDQKVQLTRKKWLKSAQKSEVIRKWLSAEVMMSAKMMGEDVKYFNFALKEVLNPEFLKAFNEAVKS